MRPLARVLALWALALLSVAALYLLQRQVDDPSEDDPSAAAAPASRNKRRHRRPSRRKRKRHGGGGGGDDDQGGDDDAPKEGDDPLDPFAPRTAATLLSVFLVAALTTAAEAGAGVYFTVIFTVLGAYALKPATGLAQAAIAGGSALPAVAALFGGRHPWDPARPLVDTDLATMLAPPLLLGVSWGVLVNDVVPEWALWLPLAVLMAASARSAWRRGRAARAEEVSAARAAAAAAAIGAAPVPSLRRIVVPASGSGGGGGGGGGDDLSGVQRASPVSRPLPVEDSSDTGSSDGGGPANGSTAAVAATQPESAPRKAAQEAPSSSLPPVTPRGGALPPAFFGGSSQDEDEEKEEAEQPSAAAAAATRGASSRPSQQPPPQLPTTTPTAPTTAPATAAAAVAAAAAAAASDPPGLRVLLAATTWLGFVGLAALDAAVPLCSLGYLAYATGFAALTAGVTTMYVRAIFVAPTARGRRRRRRRRQWPLARRVGGVLASNAAAADVEAPLLLTGAPSGSPPRRASSLFSRRHQLGGGGGGSSTNAAAAAPAPSGPPFLLSQPSLEYRDYYGASVGPSVPAAVARVQSLDVRVHQHVTGGGRLLPSGLEEPLPPPGQAAAASRLLLRARVDASALTPPISPLPSAQFSPPRPAAVAAVNGGRASYYPRSEGAEEDDGESEAGNGANGDSPGDTNENNDDEDEPAIANANPAGPARVAAGAAMVSLAAGVGAGAAGVGCGGLVAPELLQLGVHPQSAAATATLLAFMSSSAGALAHAAAGRLLVHVALAFALASALGSLVGLAAVAARPRWLRTGGKRRAGLVLTLAALAAVGGLLAVGVGALRFARAWKYDRESLRIGNVC